MKIQCNPHGGLLIACILLACDLRPPTPPSPHLPQPPLDLCYVFCGKEGMIHYFIHQITCKKVSSDWSRHNMSNKGLFWLAEDRCYLNAERGAGNEHILEQENEKWEQNLTWTLALSVTAFRILCFVPIFYYFSRPPCCFALPRFCNIFWKLDFRSHWTALCLNATRFMNSS